MAALKPSSAQLGQLAERALRADAPFDLAFPEHEPPRRNVATTALLAACHAGHHRSCWTLLHVATTESALEVGLADTISQCQEGDVSSCEAIPPLPAHPLLPKDLPGEHGRSLFQKPLAPIADEAESLRGECRAGFAYSCKVLADRSPNADERREMSVKASLAARDGCKQRLTDACALVAPDWPADERVAAADWLCQVRRSECSHLGAILMGLGRLDQARSEYERACQYGRKPERCLELAQQYRAGSLIEPVKNRANTLVKLACAALEEDATDYPECAPSP